MAAPGPDPAREGIFTVPFNGNLLVKKKVGGYLALLQLSNVLRDYPFILFVHSFFSSSGTPGTVEPDLGRQGMSQLMDRGAGKTPLLMK